MTEEFFSHFGSFVWAEPPIQIFAIKTKVLVFSFSGGCRGIAYGYPSHIAQMPHKLDWCVVAQASRTIHKARKQILTGPSKV